MFAENGVSLWQLIKEMQLKLLQCDAVQKNY
jgi:hypothetical protein